MYSIELSPDAARCLERLEKKNKPVAQRVVRAIDGLKHNPHLGKKLVGDLADFWSLRVGEYQVLYLIIEKRIVVQVFKIAHRWEVYR